MAVLDYYGVFEDGKAVTTTETTYSSTILDLGIGKNEWDDAVNIDYGVHGDLWLNVQVDTVFTSTGASTLVVALQDSPSTTSASFVSRLSSASLTTASLDAVGDWIMRAPLPMGLLRYIRLAYTVGTTIFTAGAFNAWITNSAEKRADS